MTQEEINEKLRQRIEILEAHVATLCKQVIQLERQVSSATISREGVVGEGIKPIRRRFL
jgi:hypothetical protein